MSSISNKAVTVLMRSFRYHGLAILIRPIVVYLLMAAQSTLAGDEVMIKVLITIEDTEVVALFNDNAASRDFLALLPVTLTLQDYHNTEKISDLSKTLSTQGAPEGIDPQTGDITYYAPWGNLAIFYRDFSYSRGLVRLGRIESGIDVLTQKGPLQATFKLAE